MSDKQGYVLYAQELVELSIVGEKASSSSRLPISCVPTYSIVPTVDYVLGVPLVPWVALQWASG